MTGAEELSNEIKSMLQSRGYTPKTNSLGAEYWTDGKSNFTTKILLAFHNKYGFDYIKDWVLEVEDKNDTTESWETDPDAWKS